MIAVIDNYDSFTFNLVQILRTWREDISVFRNDEITVQELEVAAPDGILISPGPGNPSAAGVSCEVIRHFAGRVPILGVCLGHQAIGAVFGARIVSAKQIVHGKTSIITANGQGIFLGISTRFTAMRYHSLVVERKTLPDTLEITATAEEEIMGIRHRHMPQNSPVEGIQFHPESIMTPLGKKILRNFITCIEQNNMHKTL